MPSRRCPAQGCGRFIATEVDHCARHAHDPTPDDNVLAEEIRALRHVLGRLMREMDDLDTLARHIPRISSVAIQAARARHHIGEGGHGDVMARLRPILEELDRRDLAHRPAATKEGRP